MKATRKRFVGALMYLSCSIIVRIWA